MPKKDTIKDGPPLEPNASIKDATDELLINDQTPKGDIPRNKKKVDDLLEDDESDEEEETEDEEEEDEGDEDEEEDDTPGRIDECMADEAKKFSDALKKIQSRSLMEKYFTENRNLFTMSHDIIKDLKEGPVSDAIRAEFKAAEQIIPTDATLLNVDELNWIIYGAGENRNRLEITKRGVKVLTYEIIANEVVEAAFHNTINTQNLKEVAAIYGLSLEEITNGTSIMAILKGMAQEDESEENKDKTDGFKSMFG